MEKNIEKTESLTAKENRLDNTIKYCEQAIETEQFSIVPLSKLKIPEYYCRTDKGGAEILLCTSILERGQIIPLIVNSNQERYNVILDGVARYEISQKAGSPAIKVIYIDVASADEKRVSEELNLRLRITPKEFLEENKLEEFMLSLISELDQSEGEKVKNLSVLGLNSESLKDDIGQLKYITSTANKTYLEELKKRWEKPNLSQVLDLIIEKFKEYENTEI